jgi:hypothetical protein
MNVKCRAGMIVFQTSQQAPAGLAIQAAFGLALE